MSLRQLAAAVACTTVILAVVTSIPAHALDAFWHGVRSDKWEDGIDPGTQQSNWYSQAPPNGAARQVPHGTATFAKDALRMSLRITSLAEVGLMQFDSDAPLYAFRVARNAALRLTGAGLKSSSTPRFTLLGHAQMNLHDDAHLVSLGATPAAQITLTDDAVLFFRDQSGGGNATVANKNNSEVGFLNHSSAENMTILNQSNGIVLFNNLASGGKAHLINQVTGLLDFTNTSGPNGDHRMPVGRIENDGFISLRYLKLVVGKSFTQTANGQLRLALYKPANSGGVVTGQNVTLGGDLVLEASPITTTGSFDVVRAGGAITGKFASVFLLGRNDLKARVAYSGKLVRVFIEEK